ncbi:hypothetical protein H4R24_001173 [Coemansia sp. RSA 988]|nr:hypothetical protein H4R24_001173 [Coemansia sp. RSA 988]
MSWKRRDKYLKKSKSSEQSTDSSSSKKQLAIRPTVICHGLLYCANEECFKPKIRRDPAIVSAADPCPDPHPKVKHWNRDAAAALHFRHILFSLCEGKGIPECFQRGNTTSPVDRSKKPTKHCKKSTKKPKTQIQKHSG